MCMDRLLIISIPHLHLHPHPHPHPSLAMTRTLLLLLLLLSIIFRGSSILHGNLRTVYFLTKFCMPTNFPPKNIFALSPSLLTPELFVTWKDPPVQVTPLPPDPNIIIYLPTCAPSHLVHCCPAENRFTGLYVPLSPLLCLLRTTSNSHPIGNEMWNQFMALLATKSANASTVLPLACPRFNNFLFHQGRQRRMDTFITCDAV